MKVILKCGERGVPDLETDIEPNFQLATDSGDIQKDARREKSEGRVASQTVQDPEGPIPEFPVGRYRSPQSCQSDGTAPRVSNLSVQPPELAELLSIELGVSLRAAELLWAGLLFD